MKIYSEKIGPVEYFRGIGFLCFFLPYAMGIPRFWPLCLIASAGALWFVERRVKREEQALRAAKSNDPRIGKIVFLFAALMLANGGLIHFLQ
jgi:hypothetical protein